MRRDRGSHTYNAYLNAAGTRRTAAAGRWAGENEEEREGKSVGAADEKGEKREKSLYGTPSFR